MKSIKIYCVGLSTIFFAAAAQAGIPLWSFTPDPNYPPQILISKTGTATVQYVVSNNSSKPHNLILQPQTGVSQNSACALGPKGSSTTNCLLTLGINGSQLPAGGLSSGPILCEADLKKKLNPGQCYQPSPADKFAVTVVQNTAVFNFSTANLALSITGLTLNGLSSGQARTITVTNNSDTVATGFHINYPSWPAGTSASSNCGSTLAAGGSCTITVTPGATPTSGAGNAACATGIAPNPGVITATASDANPASTNVFVLSYGCIYQEGFVYAMTETENTAQSIGGGVTSLGDQASRYPNGTVWSSNGGTGHGSGGADSTDVSYDLLPGIDETSTTSTSSPTYSAFASFFASTYTNSNPFSSTSFQACNGSSMGQCDVGNIFTFYNELTTNYNASGSAPFTASATPTSLTYYAAGVCANYSIDSAGNSPCATGTCYTSWYLPSICEMGPTSNSSACVAGTQNIVSNLAVLLGDPENSNPGASCSVGANCLAGAYWSATEYSPICTQGNAWYQYFANNSNSSQYGLDKNGMAGIRCSRALSI